MIIPVYRVTTSQFPIDATTTVYPGQVVKLTSTSGKVTLCGSTETPIGLAGDRNVASEALEWVNRVSDSGNDTAASGMMTVYHSGGEFYVDVDDDSIETPAGTDITGVITAGSGTSALLKPGTALYTTASGQMQTVAGSETQVAIVLEAAVNSAGVTTGVGAALDSGIPGEYEPGSSVNYATDGTNRTWVKIKLVI